MFIHEFFFLVFQLILMIRLFSEGAITLVVFLLIYVTLTVYLIQATGKKSIKIVRELLPIFSIPTFYFFLKKMTLTLNKPTKDGLLQTADTFLIGGNLSLKMENFTHPWLNELFYIVYLLFFFYIAYILFDYSRKNLLAKNFQSGFFSIYWIGFLINSFIPAGGPYVAMYDLFKTPLNEGIYLTQSIYEIIKSQANQCDLFPSLHIAVSAYCLFFDKTHAKKRFWITLPFCSLIWISTIYLRYHYFVDVITGFLLCFIALKLFGFFVYASSNIRQRDRLF